jgi:hypothetical protein
MNNAQLNKGLIAVLALSLSACSYSSPSPSTSGADNGSHTIIIGTEIPGFPGLKGSGKWSAALRPVEQFHAIELRDCMKVKVTVGMPLSISVEADDNIASAVQTKIEAGKLIISATKSFQAARAPEVIISVPELNEVSLSGSGDMIVNGIRGDLFKADISGSGTFYANGTVGSEKLTLSGSGKVDCVKLTASNATVVVSGSGSCLLNAEKTLTAKLTGSGNIKYTGSPASLTKSDTGSGTISQLTL